MQLRLHINDINDPQKLAEILKGIAAGIEAFGNEPLTDGMMRTHENGYWSFTAPKGDHTALKVEKG